jgi:dTDP-4-amino-4,6-dideoxygalactose transaminase
MPGLKYNSPTSSRRSASSNYASSTPSTPSAPDWRRATTTPWREFALRPLGRVGHPCTHVQHLYVVRIEPARLTCDRNAFMAEVIGAGVGLGLHFTAVHELTYYRQRFGDLRGALPVATDASARLFSIPLFPGLSDAEQDRVVAVLAT